MSARTGLWGAGLGNDPAYPAIGFASLLRSKQVNQHRLTAGFRKSRVGLKQGLSFHALASKRKNADA